MTLRSQALVVALLSTQAGALLGATRYVNLNNPAPLSPYTSWGTAATRIQDAVDVAGTGDTIMVTNGVYATGGRVQYGLLTNRVAVTRAIAVRSVNGPAVTVIQGYQVSGTLNGDQAVRCVYLTNGATLDGFVVSNGATRIAGDLVREQRGGGVWCESATAVVTNCTLSGNSASFGGGGAYFGTLRNCTLTGNRATVGGGTYQATLNNCVLTGNRALSYGGGAFSGTLNNCALTGNSADHGGGMGGGALTNCTLTGNAATYDGGGAWRSSLNNCVVYWNSANWSDANAFESTFNYSCTTPLPSSGPGNLANDPALAGPFHLSAASPCRGAGTAAYTSGVDIDGEAWLTPPSMGCDEFRTGSVTGPLAVAITVDWTNVAVGFEVNLQGLITGRPAASVWDFGDGVVSSNRPFTSHSWSAPGDYLVGLQAFNESNPAGVKATVRVQVVMQPVHHVAEASLTPAAPFDSWATAARTIQEAVDVASVSGALVLVSNGLYATGGRAVYGQITNRVAVDKPVTVQSVNGPGVTLIQGYQVTATTNGTGAVRCVYLADQARLSGFTLTHGATLNSGDQDREQSGGGVWCGSPRATVTNCILTGNSAFDSAGAAFGGTFCNCLLAGNSAYGGGGAFGAALYNCTVVGNSANSAGGVSGANLNNCIVYYNTCDPIMAGPNYLQSTFNYSSTDPLPDSGLGNFTAQPAFVDLAGGNFRLQSNSPCIDTGNNASVLVSTDLDGRPRVVAGVVDMGAYEYQGPGMGEFIGWLQGYSLATDGSADFTDPDGDLMTNWAEWQADTNPINPASCLRLTILPDGPPAQVVFLSSAARLYTLLRCTELTDTLPGPGWTPVSGQIDVPGNGSVLALLDTAAPGSAFYRVSVRRP